MTGPRGLPPGLLLLGLVLSLALSRPGRAHDCSADILQMERGERRPVLICGAGLTPDLRLSGLEQAGINVDYRQYLRRCSVERSGPGLYLWLQARPEARSTALRITDSQGQSLCQDLPIRVPERRVLENVRQTPGRSGDGQLIGLSLDCDELEDGWEERIGFPRAPWLARMEVEPDSVSACRRGKAGLTLRWKNGPRMPSAVVLGDAIAWVQAPEPAWRNTMQPGQARYVDVNGYRTRYFETGRGEDAIILVHGGQPDPVSPDAESWRENFAGLARGFRVIAYDVLGSGQTDPPRDEAGYADFYALVARHLYGLMEALDIRRAHLVGSSQGGWPVLRVALDHPERVRCAVSVDTVMAPFARDSSGLRVFAYTLTQLHPATGPTPESLLRERLMMAHTWNNQGWDDVHERMQAMDSPKLIAARNAMAGLRMSPGHPAFRRMREEALADLQGGRMQVPHLVLWGYNDPVATFAQGLEFFRIAAASTAATELAVINNAGHIAQVEYPEDFNAAVLGFCGRYTAR